MRPGRVNLFLLNDLLPTANHVDVKSLRAASTLREVIAAALAHQPRWMDWLFRARGIVAKILGLKHITGGFPVLKPEQIPFQPGQKLRFFSVAQAKENEYWIAEAMEDKHLQAWLAVLAEPLPPMESGRPGLRSFDFVTVVRYKRWTGWVYFNLIRPFHHLIVWAMARSAEKRLA
jgi:hypothetical protein